jgi:hypothetical protein
VAGINTGKVVAGGLVAGVAFNVGDFLGNTFLFAADFQETATRLGLDPAAMETLSGILPWVVVDFLFGLIVVWTYAAVRPRFGPGVKTALLAALPLYAAATLMVYGFTSMGIFTFGLFLKSSVFAAVNTAIGSVAGAWVYTEA